MRRPCAASASASGRSAASLAQDLLRQRAGVLGVDVDGARLERAEDDLGAAELRGGARPASPRRATSAATISPRITDSVKVFEPTTTGRPDAGSPAATATRRDSSARRDAVIRAAPRGGRRGGALRRRRNAVTNGSARRRHQRRASVPAARRARRASARRRRARCAASPRSWVTRTTVLPSARKIARRSPAARRAPAGPAPPAARRAAAPRDRASARASGSTRWRWPPDSSIGIARRAHRSGSASAPPAPRRAASMRAGSQPQVARHQRHVVARRSGAGTGRRPGST